MSEAPKMRNMTTTAQPISQNPMVPHSRPCTSSHVPRAAVEPRESRTGLSLQIFKARWRDAFSSSELEPEASHWICCINSLTNNNWLGVVEIWVIRVIEMTAWDIVFKHIVLQRWVPKSWYPWLDINQSQVSPLCKVRICSCCNPRGEPHLMAQSGSS